MANHSRFPVPTLILELVRALPPAGEPWDQDDRERWLRTFTSAVDLIYPDVGEHQQGGD